MLREGVASEARSLFGSFNGRFVLVLVCAWQVIDGLSSDESWAVIVGRVLLAPVWMLVLVCCLTFLSGVTFALVHARRPKHCYVVLDLKDGRQRRTMMCMAPCCMKAKIKRSLREVGGVTWSLGDGSDDEEFRSDEIEHWAVIPVDAPDPHGNAKPEVE